jgi:hypothetical protein
MSIRKFIRITLSAAGGAASALAFLSLNLTCSNLVVPEEIKPGRRDYVWTIDTLEYPGSFQTSMWDIWGSSLNNVYVVGHNDQAYGNMYRYDGNKWNAIDIGEYLGFRNVGLASLFGFGLNDIWVVGAEAYSMVVPPYTTTFESLIIKIDGSNWIKMNIEKRDFLLTINGSSPNNIFAGGIYGSFYQYDGTTWRRINFDTTLSVKSIVTLSSEKTYVMSYVQKQSERAYFDFYDGNSFVRLDSSTWYDRTFGQAEIWSSDNKTLYSVGDGGVYQWEGSKWKNILNTPDIIRRIRGSHIKNIFAVGVNLIYHFNGTDWYQYPSFVKDWVLWTGIWTDGKEVFICGHSAGGRKTYILHGK